MSLKFTEEQKANLWKLFDEHVDAGIKTYRRNCAESIPSVDINLVCSLCALYKSLTLETGGGADIPWEDIEESDKLLSWLFVFSYTWSIGENTALALSPSLPLSLSLRARVCVFLTLSVSLQVGTRTLRGTRLWTSSFATSSTV